MFFRSDVEFKFDIVLLTTIFLIELDLYYEVGELRCNYVNVYSNIHID